MKFETKAIRTKIDDTSFREHSSAIYASSSFYYNSAEQMRAVFADEEESYIYSRFSNPNCTELELKLAELEGTESSFVTASGMSAIFSSFMSLLRSGDHILASKALFGSSIKLISHWLTRWNISYDFVDASDLEEIRSCLRKTTKLLFIETPSNPRLDIYDISKLANFCDQHQLIFIVDNCFSTPYLQQPAKFGAHIIIHSATKYLDGQGRVIGGAVCGSSEHIDQIRSFCRATGPSLSPFNAWILSKSLETLSIRMQKHSENAYKIAQYLTEHPKLNKVIYPFLKSHPDHDLALKQMKMGGGIVSFELPELQDGINFLNRLSLISLTANLGDTRSIASHPASTTHAKLTSEERLDLGITDGLIRISVGLEHESDLINDIKNALN